MHLNRSLTLLLSVFSISALLVACSSDADTEPQQAAGAAGSAGSSEAGAAGAAGTGVGDAGTGDATNDGTAGSSGHAASCLGRGDPCGHTTLTCCSPLFCVAEPADGGRCGDGLGWW